MSTPYPTAGDGAFYTPFNLTLDPMERLLLINFNKDPDRLYTAFEPQYFDDDKRGRGLIVIAYLENEQFDIYHQPGLVLNRADYNIVGKGLRELVERPFTDARFDIGPHGIDLDIQFDDFAGRPVELLIRERGLKPASPFAILAPLGNSTESPPALPLYFLYDFYFVRRAQTELLISIDGRAHKPDSIPMVLDGARVHFLRYSADPFLAAWNEACEGELMPIQAAGGEQGANHGRVEDGPVFYELRYSQGHPEIAVMGIANDRHELRIAFEPPLPDVVGVADGSTVEGSFTIRGGAGAGLVNGEYRVERAGPYVDLSLRPTGGWQPDVDRWSVKLIFAVVPIFKKWPATYEWTARIELRDGRPPFMRAYWRRLGEEGQGRVIRLFGS
ncbi:MAG: hypothetical protein R6X18_08295 [Chloroflexota bacterium]